MCDLRKKLCLLKSGASKESAQDEHFYVEWMENFASKPGRYYDTQLRELMVEVNRTYRAGELHHEEEEEHHEEEEEPHHDHEQVMVTCLYM